MQLLPTAHKGDVYAVTSFQETPQSKRLLISAGHDQSICIWDFDNKSLLRRMSDCHSHLVKCLATCSYEGCNYLVSGSWDMLVKVWNLDSGKMIHSLQGHSNRVKAAVCFVPNDDTGFPLIISAILFAT